MCFDHQTIGNIAILTRKAYVEQIIIIALFIFARTERKMNGKFNKIQE